MAAKIKVTVKTPKKIPYTVEGDTLAGIWKQIEKIGPTDGSTNVAGYTRAPARMTKLKCPPVCTQDKNTSEWSCKVEPSEIEFQLDPVTIQHPKLKSDKNLSDKARKHWKSFMSKLMDHEQEHVDSTKAETEKIAAELAKLSVTETETDADKKKAEKAAAKAFEKEFKSRFGGTYMPARLKAANQKLDSSGHGPTLDTSIP